MPFTSKIKTGIYHKKPMRPQSKTNKLTEAQEENGSPADDWFKYCIGFVEREKVAHTVKLVLSSHMQRMTW